MSAPKHTPGPWRVVPTGAGNVLIQSDSVSQTVATVHGAEQAANARLIAAAPELLEALQLAVGIIENHPAMGAMAVPPSFRAAIAKAEGREP